MLLKNEGNLLPLDGTKPLRLLVTGPNADEIYSQLGDYTPGPAGIWRDGAPGTGAVGGRDAGPGLLCPWLSGLCH